MANILRSLSNTFTAGTAGGVINSLAVWIFGQYGLTTSLGVRIAPDLTPGWLYPRLVWGGLWGLFFLLPLFSGRWVLRGLFFSLGPSLMQLFYVFPYQAGQGQLGLALGALTPAFVLFFNALWGLSASAWLEAGR